MCVHLTGLNFAACAEEVAFGVLGADMSFDLSGLMQLQRPSEAQLAIPMSVTILLALVQYVIVDYARRLHSLRRSGRLPIFDVVLVARQSELRKRQTSSQHARVRKLLALDAASQLNLFP